MSQHPLPIPLHFEPATVGKVWRVAYQQRAEEAEKWAKSREIAPAESDRRRVGLLLVDCQNTFCMPEFELFVAGSSGRGGVEDNVRLCQFIYHNLNRITQVIATLDTHAAMQIFHPLFWVDAEGRHPVGGETTISLEDVRQGRWKINPAMAPSATEGDVEGLQRYAEYYVGVLNERGKFPLMVWPYHAMLGGIGHALTPAIEEAVFFHGVARSSHPHYEIKGRHPLTENYSALHPEVRQDREGKPLAGDNQEFIDKLLNYDRLIVAGQAKSHCVAWTVDDLLVEASARDASLVRSVYLLEDCTSPVVVPGGVDFSESADQAFTRFAEAGMHRVRSVDPIDTWPEMTT